MLVALVQTHLFVMLNMVFVPQCTMIGQPRKRCVNKQETIIIVIIAQL
jgi:hypothetical protein